MSQYQIWPNLIASEDITPYTFIVCDGESTCAVAGVDAIPDGVTAGGTKAFDEASLHAEAGDPVSLQSGFVVYVQTSEAVAAADLIMPNASGLATVADTSGDYAVGRALEAASAAGERIRVRLFGTAYLVP